MLPNNAPLPKKEFTIEYDLEKVTSAIKEISGFVKPSDGNGFYTNTKESNEIFGLYVFNIFRSDFNAGLVTGKMQVQVEPSGEKTKIIISSTQASRGVLDATRVQETENHFLKLLTGRLTGSSNLEQMTPAKSSGCLTILAIATVGLLVFYM